MLVNVSCYSTTLITEEKEHKLSVKHTLSHQRIVKGDNVTLWLGILLNLTHYLDSSAYLDTTHT